MNLYQTYFANVRWVEFFLAVGMTILGKLQLTVQNGGKIDQRATIEALCAGGAVAWAFLRVPKSKDEVREEGVDFGSLTPGSLPAGVDATGPSHDVAADVIEDAISGLLPPIVAKAAPDLAKNIVGELGRVLRRGIKL
jgi:hypothetical protein